MRTSMSRADTLLLALHIPIVPSLTLILLLTLPCPSPASSPPPSILQPDAAQVSAQQAGDFQRFKVYPSTTDTTRTPIEFTSTFAMVCSQAARDREEEGRGRKEEKKEGNGDGFSVEKLKM